MVGAGVFDFAGRLIGLTTPDGRTGCCCERLAI
jgi:hypothetical protein